MPSYDETIPEAPPTRGCWLIPTEDGWAVKLCERKAHLERLGWQILACDVETTREVMDKVRLRGRARQGEGQGDGIEVPIGRVETNVLERA